MSRLIGDQMRQAVYTNAFTVDQRLERLHDLSGQAIAICEDHLEDPLTRLEALDCADWLAAVPSLARIAEREPHDRSVAIDVYENMHGLFSRILEYEGVHFAQERPEGAPKDYHTDIEGKLTELSVFGLLWWGAAHTDQEHKAILPATTEQDYGPIESGHRTGIDIVISDGTYEQPVQVKQGKVLRRGKKLPYKPGIPILRPTRLLGPEMKGLALRYTTLLLMDMLVQEDSYGLFKAHNRAQIAIHQAKREGIRHQRRLFKSY